MNIFDIEKENKELIALLEKLEKEKEELQKELDNILSRVGNFKNITLPLVARVFPELVTKDLVSVQPMTMPTGLAYALRYRYVSNPVNEKLYNVIKVGI